MNAPILNTEKTLYKWGGDQSDSLIAVSEIFGPTIQGEGALIGAQTIFVRTGGCDYRCDWCDTGYAVLQQYENDWKSMDAESIFKEIEELSNKQPMWITLSGGNPAMQDLEPLIKLGQANGYKFSMETQGSISKPWFALLDQLTFSPKPPSSSMKFKQRGLTRCFEACNENDNCDKGLPEISLKFVVANQNDLIWAKNIADQYPIIPSYVQPCNGDGDIQIDNRNISPEGGQKDSDIQQKQMLWLIEAVQSLNWSDVRILPQLHVWLNVE